MFFRSSQTNVKMSKDRIPARPVTGIPVRTSGPHSSSSAARAILFPTPVSGSEVASPKTSTRENVVRNENVVANVAKNGNDGSVSTSSSDDDDAVLDKCIKVAWLKNGEENKLV